MIELVKVEDAGGAYALVTFRMQRRLIAYLTIILDQLLGVARHLHWRARVAAADRRALIRVSQGGAGDPKEVTRIRDEMIFFLRSELDWKTTAIAEVYELTPQNVRKILSRRRQANPL